jgi:hypothetical protein
LEGAVETESYHHARPDAELFKCPLFRRDESVHVLGVAEESVGDGLEPSGAAGFAPADRLDQVNDFVFPQSL